MPEQVHTAKAPVAELRSQQNFGIPTFGAGRLDPLDTACGNPSLSYLLHVSTALVSMA